MSLIHCQSTLNWGSIITEIYCMNGMNVKAVVINNFQIRPCADQTWIDFLFRNIYSSLSYLKRKVLLESFWYFLQFLEGQNPNETSVEERFRLSLLRMKVKIQFCKYVGALAFELMCSSIYLSEQSCTFFSQSRPASENTICFCATEFHMNSWVLGTLSESNEGPRSFPLMGIPI